MSDIDLAGDRVSEIDVRALIGEARGGDRSSLGRLLQLYRNYLTILATTQLNARLRGRVGPSDLVQETMLAVHRDIQQFRGSSEGEFLTWLRQILIHCLHHAVQTHVTAKKRDIRCEVSIDQAAVALSRSGFRLANSLVDPGPSPSSALRREECCALLADQLSRLKPEYREVIVLRNLRGMPFEQIAEQLNRKPGTVRMLWLRAMQRLKEICDPIE